MLRIKTPHDMLYSKAVFSGFMRSFEKKTREENLTILVQSSGEREREREREILLNLPNSRLHDYVRVNILLQVQV